MASGLSTPRRSRPSFTPSRWWRYAAHSSGSMPSSAIPERTFRAIDAGLSLSPMWKLRRRIAMTGR